MSSDFSHQNLHDADFRNADLRRANFRYAYLHKADFRGANLEFADFTGADMRGCLFDEHTYFRDADFRDADLSGTLFDGFQDSYERPCCRFRQYLATLYGDVDVEDEEGEDLQQSCIEAIESVTVLACNYRHAEKISMECVRPYGKKKGDYLDIN